MARRKHQDNLRDILILVNQTTQPRLYERIEKQKELLQFLSSRSRQRATRKEIEAFLHIEFSHLKKADRIRWRKQKQFYKIVSPLKNTFLFCDSEELSYELSEPIFSRWIDSLRRTGKDLFGGN